MQKRRVKGSSDLPVTMSDATASSSGSISNSRTSRAERRLRRRNKESDGSCLLSFGLFFLFCFVLGIILFSDFDYVSHHPLKTSSSSSSSSSEYMQHVGTSLTKFSSLKYALDNAELVGLYFAASWCPMSTPVTKKIDELFSMDTSPLKQHVLEPPLTILSEIGPIESNNDEKKDIALVYVSSDDTESEMMKYSKNNWMNVPFDSKDRNDIKRHFRICAEVEMDSLGIERRRSEIPSLIIIDSATHGILSVSGKNDILEHGEGVLDAWMNLKHLLRFLEDKYVNGEEE